MFKSIRWTLQIWHAGVLLLALSGLGAALYGGARYSILKQVDADLEGAARVLASIPPGPPPGFRGGNFGDPRRDVRGPRDNGDRPPEGDRHDPSESRSPDDRPPGPDADRPGPRERQRDGPPPDWLAQVPRDVLRRVGQDERDQPYFVLWAADGKVLRSSSLGSDAPATVLADGPPGSPGRPGDPPGRRWRGNRREVALAGPFGITLVVGKSLEREYAALARLRWILIGAGTSVMLIGLAGGWILASRAIRPIQEITHTARLISATDFSCRINLQETKSELGALAQTLNQTFDRLESDFRRQVRFTADASHELRTPLSVIHSHTELALSKERTAPEYRQTIETCLRAASRMKALVESLLVLARADAGKLDLRLEPLHLREVAEECLALVAPQAQERKIRLESDLGDVAIEADRTRIGQLLTNLLSNAIRYNSEGGVVRLSLNQEGPRTILTVADTGVGIAQEDQPRVFERFFRADKARSREAGGSGLGLAICQSIVDAHHGSIRFTSRPGEGSTFVVSLPSSLNGTS